MNKDITKLILIVGLVYISVTQKKESTRNIMLLITGLLGFCMYTKVEGYCTIPEELISPEGRTNLSTSWNQRGIAAPTGNLVIDSDFDGSNYNLPSGGSAFARDVFQGDDGFIDGMFYNVAYLRGMSSEEHHFPQANLVCNVDGEPRGATLQVSARSTCMSTNNADDGSIVIQQTDLQYWDGSSLQECPAPPQENPAGGGVGNEVRGCQTSANGVDGDAYDISRITGVPAGDSLTGTDAGGPLCNSGYFGTPTATCSADGGEYTLDGCTPCPDGSTPVLDSGTGGQAARCGSAAAVGDEPSCQSLSGSNTPTGYHFTTPDEVSTESWATAETTESLSIANYNVDNLLCDVGHYGTPIVEVCSEADGAPNLSGCVQCPEDREGGTQENPGNENNIVTRCGTEVPDIPSNCQDYECRPEYIKKTEFQDGGTAEEQLKPENAEVDWGDSVCCELLSERDTRRDTDRDIQEACACGINPDEDGTNNIYYSPNKYCKRRENEKAGNTSWVNEAGGLTQNFDSRGRPCSASTSILPYFWENERGYCTFPTEGGRPADVCQVQPRGEAPGYFDELFGDERIADITQIALTQGPAAAGSAVATEAAAAASGALEDTDFIDDVLDFLGMGGD